MTKSRVVAIHLCVGHREPLLGVYQATAIAGLGLEGDRHAKEDSPRQVLLIDREILTELKLVPGMVRENITVEGAHLQGRPLGSRISLGPEVILEITAACVGCVRMDEIRPGLREELADRRGMVARVVQGGTITAGDAVTVTEGVLQEHS